MNLFFHQGPGAWNIGINVVQFDVDAWRAVGSEQCHVQWPAALALPVEISSKTWSPAPRVGCVCNVRGWMLHMCSGDPGVSRAAPWIL